MAFSRSHKILLGLFSLVVLSGAGIATKKLLVPRGIRNNNPGNLRDSTIAWQGEVPANQKKDQEFEEFISMVWGIRALILDIKNDINKGKNTIHDLIYEFAPGHENNTQAYIDFIVAHTPFTEYQTLIAEKSRLYWLVKAIAHMENGKDIITPELYNQAYALI